MPDTFELLTCIRCVARVDATSDEAEGWVLVPHFADQDDEHDDKQWVCPDCDTASEELVGDPDRLVHDALERDDAA
jgi:hypothetical protein